MPLLEPHELYSPDKEREPSPEEDGCPLLSSHSSVEASSPSQSGPIDFFLKDTSARQERMLGLPSVDNQIADPSDLAHSAMEDPIPELSLVETYQLASPPPTRPISGSASANASVQSGSGPGQTEASGPMVTSEAQGCGWLDTIEPDDAPAEEWESELRMDDRFRGTKRPRAASFFSTRYVRPLH